MIYPDNRCITLFDRDFPTFQQELMQKLKHSFWEESTIQEIYQACIDTINQMGKGTPLAVREIALKALPNVSNLNQLHEETSSVICTEVRNALYAAGCFHA